MSSKSDIQLNRNFLLKALAATVLTALLVYIQAIDQPFYSDDFEVMFRLSHRDFETGIFLRPLGDFFLFLQYQVSGFFAPSFHFVNIVLHGLCGFVVVLLALQFGEFPGGIRDRSVALVSGLLFVCYPMHVETVVWVIGRGIMLSTLFFLLSLFFYLRAGGSHAWMRWVSVACFAIALAGYETALALPLIIFIVAIFRKREIRSAVADTLPYLGVTILYFVLRSRVLADLVGGEYFRTGSGLTTWLYNYATLIGRSFIFPSQNSNIFLVCLGAGVVVLFALGVRLKRTDSTGFRYCAFMAVLLLCSLCPLITVGISTHDHEGGRFLYQAGIFTGLLLIRLCCGLSGRLLPAVLLILVGITGTLFVLHQWDVAGSRIRSAMASLPLLTTPYRLTGAPDKFGSAYMFRHGLSEACVIYGKDDVPDTGAGQGRTVSSGNVPEKVFHYRNGVFVLVNP